MKNKPGRIIVPTAGIPKLETGNSRDVFVLFAALNAMGYDEENNTKGMTPVRKKSGTFFRAATGMKSTLA